MSGMSVILTILSLALGRLNLSGYLVRHVHRIKYIRSVSSSDHILCTMHIDSADFVTGIPRVTRI